MAGEVQAAQQGPVLHHPRLLIRVRVDALGHPVVSRCGEYDNVYIQVLDENGRNVEKKVDKVRFFVSPPFWVSLTIAWFLSAFHRPSWTLQMARTASSGSPYDTRAKYRDYIYVAHM
jgi:hypothetical protein